MPAWTNNGRKTAEDDDDDIYSKINYKCNIKTSPCHECTTLDEADTLLHKVHSKVPQRLH